MAVTYRVHESTVLSYMENVEDLVWDTLRTTRDLAKLYAPARTGRLRQSIRATRPRRNGVYTYSGTCSASVKHALWVHDGVPGRIYPKRGKYLTVPKMKGAVSGATLRKGGGPRMYWLAKSVRGQRAQPFLADALKDSMAANGLLYLRVS